MLASAVIRVADLLAFVLTAGMVPLVVGLWWLQHRMRRLGRTAWAGVAATGAAASGWHRGWWLLFPDRRWLAVTRERRRLWRTAGVAERAVAAARQAGAPIGGLGGLCRRLCQAAAQIGDLAEVAGQIHDAAPPTVAVMTWPASRYPAEDAHREARALAAGIAAANLAGDRL